MKVAILILFIFSQSVFANTEDPILRAASSGDIVFMNSYIDSHQGNVSSDTAKSALSLLNSQYVDSPLTVDIILIEKLRAIAFKS